MEIKQINRDTTAYVYDDIDNYITNVFLIERKNKVFIIDTFCGSESMEPVLKKLSEIPKEKERIVINTHAHWDHFWGNCSFKGENIISHELCKDLMDQSWDEQIKKNGRYILGQAVKYLPNITFSEKMIFHDEQIELFYSPGHTSDSISIFDWKEQILYTGDNLEKPIIHVEERDVDLYIKTLENYLTYDSKKIISSHTLYLTEEDVQNSISYLKDLSSCKEMHFEREHVEEIHLKNLRVLRGE